MHDSIARFESLGRRILKVLPEFFKHSNLFLLFLKGIHPEHYLRLNVKWLRDANIRTVIDIGANTGQFSGAARAVFANASIYAFEPVPKCFRHLSKRFSADKDTVVFPWALGDQTGQVEFHENAYTQSSSVLELEDLHRTSRAWAARAQSIDVEMKRLDDLASQINVRENLLVKIDVQGYEYEVLEGGKNIIGRADIVLVETAFKALYKGEASFDRLYRSLSKLGFQYAGNLNQASDLVSGRPIFADAIFVRRQ
jgi:FkbM family methyltransferase